MMVMGAVFLVGILWVLYGYSMTFSTDVGNSGLVGSLTEFARLNNLMTDDPAAVFPAMSFVAFKPCSRPSPVALIAGAIADRVKFGMWMVFAGIWATLVYFPVAHWVWGAGGWIFEGLGPLRGTPAIDFAGGTAVHINAGAAIGAGDRARQASGMAEPR